MFLRSEGWMDNPRETPLQKLMLMPITYTSKRGQLSRGVVLSSKFVQFWINFGNITNTYYLIIFVACHFSSCALLNVCLDTAASYFHGLIGCDNCCPSLWVLGLSRPSWKREAYTIDFVICGHATFWQTVKDPIQLHEGCRSRDNRQSARLKFRTVNL